jgi:hypothetical protein
VRRGNFRKRKRKRSRIKLGEKLEGIVLSRVSSSVANVGLARAEESAEQLARLDTDLGMDKKEEQRMDRIQEQREELQREREIRARAALRVTASEPVTEPAVSSEARGDLTNIPDHDSPDIH